MATLKSKKHDQSIVTHTRARDFIMKHCNQCQRSFLAKYWDDELDWYIELNPTGTCHECQKIK